MREGYVKGRVRGALHGGEILEDEKVRPESSPDGIIKSWENPFGNASFCHAVGQGDLISGIHDGVESIERRVESNASL
jgi:hypothetical protein